VITGVSSKQKNGKKLDKTMYNTYSLQSVKFLIKYMMKVLHLELLTLERI